MCSNQGNVSRRGLSRIDFIVVLCVTATAIGLLIVTLGRQRREDSRSIHRNHLKQMALAIHAYHGDIRQLPPAFDQSRRAGLDFPASIHVHLLPYMEQDELFKSCRKQGKVVDDAVVFPFLAREEEHEAGVQHFAANLRVFSDKGVTTPFDRPVFRLAEIEPGTAQMPKTFTDGTSNTIVFATKYARCGAGGSRYAAAPNSPFAAFFGETPAMTTANATSQDVTFQLVPFDHECLVRPLLAQSFRESGIFVGLADGAVRTVSAKISPFTWNAAMQPNDGKALGEDW